MTTKKTNSNPVKDSSDSDESTESDEDMSGSDGDSYDDEDDEVESMNEDDVIVPPGDQEVNVEFEAFPPSDQDFQGLMALLSRLFQKESMNLVQMVEWIIGHNYVGSVLKTNSGEPNEEDTDSEDDDQDETVYGITTVISLKPSGNKDSFKDELKNYFKTHCNQEEFISTLNDPAKSVGLLLTERFINIPPLLAPPMLKCLNKELESANKKKLPYNFSHIVLISKTCDASGPENEGLPPSLEFLNAEDEIFQQHADTVISFPVVESEDLVAGIWSSSDTTMKQYRTVLLMKKEKFNAAVDKIAKVFSVENLMKMQ